MNRMAVWLGSLFVVSEVARAAVFISAGPSAGTTFGDIPGGFGGNLERASGVYGGQVVLRGTSPFSIELSALRMNDWDSEERFGITAEGTDHITPITVSARYAVPLHGETVRGYGLAGAGWYHHEKMDLSFGGLEQHPGLVAVNGVATLDMKETVGYHAGAGLEWSISPKAELFAEYRFAVLENSASLSGITPLNADGAFFIGKVKEDFEDNTDIGIGRIGLNYRFWTF